MKSSLNNELASAIKKTPLIDDDVFDNTKKYAESFYKDIKPTYCPYLKTKVNFNTKGLNHIKFKAWKKSRSRKDQYVRFKFVQLLPKIISESSNLQGIHEVRQTVKKKSFGSWAEVFSMTKYYEFIYVHKEKVRVKVIVRKDGTGEPYFYSVIPFWKTDKKNNKKILSDGNPEED